jgi:hypothetical protein
MREKAITWTAIERDFRHEDYCPAMFIYAAVVRDPLSLMESYLNFQATMSPPRIEYAYHNASNLRKHISGCLLRGTEKCHGSQSPTVITAFVHFDNYVVRVLGGSEVMRLPPNGINATHAKKALHMLNTFDTVVRLEDFGKPALNNIFQEAFGWHNFSILSQGDSPINSNEHEVRFSSEEREQLRKLNKYDYMLYQSVKSL